jgi:RNA-binding protein
MIGKEKRKLRAQGNRLKASVYIGKEGVTDKVIRFIYEALGNKELIKIKVLDSKSEQFKMIVDQLSNLKDIEIVQVLGRTVLLFRPLPEEDKG